MNIKHSILLLSALLSGRSMQAMDLLTLPAEKSEKSRTQAFEAQDARLWAPFAEPRNALAVASALKDRLLFVGKLFSTNSQKAEILAPKFLEELPRLVEQCDAPILACKVEFEFNNALQSGAFGVCLQNLIVLCEAAPQSDYAKAKGLFAGMMSILSAQSKQAALRAQSIKQIDAGEWTDRPKYNPKQVEHLTIEERLVTPLPVEHHCAAVELYTRLALCFGTESGAELKKQRETLIEEITALEPRMLKFYVEMHGEERAKIEWKKHVGAFVKKEKVKLQEQLRALDRDPTLPKKHLDALINVLPKLIEPCDGPLEDVWFRTAPSWFLGSKKDRKYCAQKEENCLFGYIEAIQRTFEVLDDEEGAVALLKPGMSSLVSILADQKASCQSAENVKKPVNTYKLPKGKGSCERWSWYHGAWVRMDSGLLDPTDSKYDRNMRELHANLVTKCKYYAQDGDDEVSEEQFLPFLSDLERQIATPTKNAPGYLENSWYTLSALEEEEIMKASSEKRRRWGNATGIDTTGNGRAIKILGVLSAQLKADTIANWLKDTDASKRFMEPAGVEWDSFNGGFTAKVKELTYQEYAKVIEDPYEQPNQGLLLDSMNPLGLDGFTDGLLARRAPHVVLLEDDDNDSFLTLPAPDQEETDTWLAGLITIAQGGGALRLTDGK